MTGGVLLAVLLMVFGGNSRGEAPRGTPRPEAQRPAPTSEQARRLLGRALSVGVGCRPIRGSKFHCLLPALMGDAVVELGWKGDRYEIRGCGEDSTVCTFRNPRSAHRAAADESAAERHAANLLNDGYAGIGKVTCAHLRSRHFDCDGFFGAEGIDERVNLELEVLPSGYHFISECRLVAIRRGTVPLACQRLAWKVNFPQSEALALSHGGIASYRG